MSLVILLALVVAVKSDDNLLLTYSSVVEFSPSGTTVDLSQLTSDVGSVVSVVKITDQQFLLADYEASKSNLFRIDSANASFISQDKMSLKLVESLSWDSVGEMLYLSDSKDGRISKVKYQDGKITSTQQTLVKYENGEKPKQIVFDQCQNELIWSVWNTKSGHQISKMSLSSSNATEENLLLNTKAYGLHLDQWTRRLYWMQMGQNGQWDIKTSYLDGSSVSTVCSVKNHSPFDLVVDEDFIYWSDMHNLAIWKTAKSQNSQEYCHTEAIKRVKSAKPMGLALLKQNQNQCHMDPVTLTQTTEIPTTKSDACSSYCLNGTCSLTSVGVAVCYCSDGYTGDRCQSHKCDGFCSNGGECFIDGVTKEPACRCTHAFTGLTCQDNIATGATLTNSKSSLPLILFCIFSSVILLTCSAVGAFVWRRKRTGQPTIVRRNQHAGLFSGGDGRRSKSVEVDVASGVANERNVEIDLEDCCKMTICHTPCVEASFRKATRRSSSKESCLSPSKLLKSSPLKRQAQCQEDKDFLLNEVVEED